MINEKIFLHQSRDDVYLTTYVADAISQNDTRDALLVLPGGAYIDCSNRESEPIALAFAGKGMNAFVLQYSVKEKAVFPNPLVDVALAIKHIKENSKKYNIDPERIFVIGFSAGGHLAGSIATLWDSDDIYNNCDMPKGMAKPRGAILGYPVISGGKFAHFGSFKTLLGKEEPTEKELKKYSLEHCVSEKTVPCFMFHTSGDEAVPAENSLLFAASLSKYNIPYELHIYPNGWHGISLATPFVYDNSPNCMPEAQGWVDLAFAWMQRN